MGTPSLVQLTLYKQWMWAKDVALSCFPVELDASPDFVQNEPSVTGGSQEFWESEGRTLPGEEQSQQHTWNRRKRITQYARQCQEDQKRRR
eukprot:6430855-Pyramimonas_sp.AAC.1